MEVASTAWNDYLGTVSADDVPLLSRGANLDEIVGLDATTESWSASTSSESEGCWSCRFSRPPEVDTQRRLTTWSTCPGSYR